MGGGSQTTELEILCELKVNDSESMTNVNFVKDIRILKVVNLDALIIKVLNPIKTRL